MLILYYVSVLTFSGPSNGLRFNKDPTVPWQLATAAWCAKSVWSCRQRIKKSQVSQLANWLWRSSEAVEKCADSTCSTTCWFHNAALKTLKTGLAWHGSQTSWWISGLQVVLYCFIHLCLPNNSCAEKCQWNWNSPMHAFPSPAMGSFSIRSTELTAEHATALPGTGLRSNFSLWPQIAMSHSAGGKTRSISLQDVSVYVSLMHHEKMEKYGTRTRPFWISCAFRNDFGCFLGMLYAFSLSVPYQDGTAPHSRRRRRHRPRVHAITTMTKCQGVKKALFATRMFVCTAKQRRISVRISVSGMRFLRRLRLRQLRSRSKDLALIDLAIATVICCGCRPWATWASTKRSDLDIAHMTSHDHLKDCAGYWKKTYRK